MVIIILLMNKFLKRTFVLLGLTFLFTKSNAQNAFLNSLQLADAKRVSSLLDSSEPNSPSYFLRFGMDTTIWKAPKKSNIKFILNQVTATIQNNSQLTTGYNDGSMIPSVGIQQMYSVGMDFFWKKIQLHLQPEFIKADNLQPDGMFWDYNQENYWSRLYAKQINIIDNPERFGVNKFQKFFPGQSSLLFNHKDFSVGFSTENIWWGPGVYHSLLFTNNAPGFFHFTFQTRKPLKTPIGSFEMHMITGQLDASGYEPPENSNPNAAPYYIAKKNDPRLLTGVHVNYQPKWVRNLYVGISTVSYMYDKDMKTILNYLPFDQLLYKYDKRASLGSISVRYAMPKDHAEIYFEYGRNDRFASPSNLVKDTIPYGYIGGLRKLFPLKKNRGAIAVHLEVVHLQMPDARLIFDQSNDGLMSRPTSWYTHPSIREGFTQLGQVLGSAAGPGGAAQLINISWVKNLNKIGFQFERKLHNADFYYYNYFQGLVYPGPNFKYFTELGYSFNFRFQIKKFIIAGEVKNISSLNYKWIKIGEDEMWGSSTLSDKQNIQSMLSFQYKF